MVLLYLVLCISPVEQSKKPFMRNFKNVLWENHHNYILKLFCKALGSSKSQANKRYKITFVFLKPVTIRIKQNWLLWVDYRNNAARDANIGQNLLEKRKKVLASEVMCSWGHATCSIVNIRCLVAGVKK